MRRLKVLENRTEAGKNAIVDEGFVFFGSLAKTPAINEIQYISKIFKRVGELVEDWEKLNGYISESSMVTSIAVPPPMQPIVPNTQVAEISLLVQS